MLLPLPPPRAPSRKIIESKSLFARANSLILDRGPYKAEVSSSLAFPRVAVTVPLGVPELPLGVPESPVSDDAARGGGDGYGSQVNAGPKAAAAARSSVGFHANIPPGPPPPPPRPSTSSPPATLLPLPSIPPQCLISCALCALLTSHLWGRDPTPAVGAKGGANAPPILPLDHGGAKAPPIPLDHGGANWGLVAVVDPPALPPPEKAAMVVGGGT